MYQSVLHLCQRRNWVWGDLAAFSSALQQFSERVEAIEHLFRNQRRHTGGAAGEKRQSREDLCVTAHQISAAIVSWAAPQRPEMMGRVRFSITQLRTGKGALCLERCRTILAEAKKHIDDLAHHGVSAEKLDRLRERIDAFDAIVHQPKQIQGENKKLTAQLAVEFAAADQILYHQLDNLIHHFRDSHSEFHAAYGDERVMRQAGGEKSQSTPSITAAVPEENMVD